MAKRLILMRHAKSSWGSGVARDHDRPLNDRGRASAPRVAVKLRELGWNPELVFSSDAERTRETFKVMRSALGGDVDAQFSSSLYLGGVDQVREVLMNIGEPANTVLCLGHNPGWEEAIYWFCGESVTMKTASAALLSASDDPWGDLAQSAGQFDLVELIHPREL